MLPREYVELTARLSERVPITGWNVGEHKTRRNQSCVPFDGIAVGTQLAASVRAKEETAEEASRR
jgi:hypothetical protein